MGHEEADFDAVKDYWTARVAALEEQIQTESEEIKNSPINQEVKMLDYIKDAVNFVTDKKSDGDDGDSDGGDAASTDEQMTISDDSEKKVQEQARQAQQMQASQQQAQQQAQAHQNGHRKRVSLKERLNKGYESVRKYDEDRQATIARGEITTKKRDEQNLS